MTKKPIESLGWIDNKWEKIENLYVPICDRGLQMADGIFETVLILNGEAKLLEEHLKRWNKSADKLGMLPPPDLDWLKPVIEKGLQITSIKNGSMRLNWTRGNNIHRGITISKSAQVKEKHRFWLELHSCEPSFNPLDTLISQTERRNAYSSLSTCKTFAYNQGIQARKEAHDLGFDDAIILNTDGEVCCGTTSNLLVHRENEWLTPRNISGCLPGIMRGMGIKKGLFKEAIINECPKENDQWLLINSLSCHPISRVNERYLKPWINPKELWEKLLIKI